MRILMIDVYAYRKGGAESVCFNTIDMLRSHGHEVALFAMKWPGNQRSEYERYFPESKETLKGLTGKFKAMVNYFNNSEAARKLEDMIEEFRPDIAHIHLMWGQLSGSILPVLRRHGVPTIFTVHDYRLVCPAYTFRNGHGKVCEKCGDGDYYHCFTNRCTKGSYILSAVMAAEQYYRNRHFNPLRYFSGFIYVSDFARAKQEQYMPGAKALPSIRLYNTVPGTAIAKTARSADPYFLFFGRLSHEKGVTTLLKAMRALPDCKLKIAGTGPLEKEIKTYITDNAMTNVEMLGYKSGQELKDLVSGADFVVVPSEWYENNPMTIVEAYFMGVPVIGTDIGGIPEIIVDRRRQDYRDTADPITAGQSQQPDQSDESRSPLMPTGYIVKPGDTDSIAEALNIARNLTDREYLALSEGAAEFARRNFNPDTYYPTLIDFYHRILELPPATH